MKLKEVYEAADRLAPFSLSRELTERYGHYDNSGIMLDCGREIKGILFSLDLSLAAVAEAKQRGCNCIFTHHPAIWEGVKHLTAEDTPALFACVREGISVISAHLNLDAAPGGIDESFMSALGGKEPIAVLEPLSAGGYGRVYDVPACSLEEFAAHAEEVLQTRRAVCYGNNTVRRAASFCGGGFDGSALSFALAQGADTLISSDGKHHLIAEAVEKGLNVVLLTHYAAEAFGLAAFCERLKGSLPVPCFFFGDGRLL